MMKTTIFTIIFLWAICLCSGAYSQSTGENYIAVYQPTVPIGSDNYFPGFDKDTVIKTVRYYDGLGRKSQIIQVWGSPLGKDLVQPIKYDGLGREVQKYLVYPGSNSNGSYVSSALTGQSAYYTGLYGSTDGTKAYAETVFDNSPINRVLVQGAPGYAWQPLQHPVKYAYKTNEMDKVNEVKRWKVVNDQLTDGGYYEKGYLSKTITWDENNLKSVNTSHTEEFKDAIGRVMLKVSYNGTAAHPTYYVYDDFNRLRFVLPPKAVEDGSVSSTELDQLCYQYNYDNQNRMSEKKLPGAGWEYLIYDMCDRLVLSQDAKLRAVNANQYHYILYNNLDRPVETGICTESTAYTTLRTNVSNSSNYTPAIRSAEVYTYYDDYTTVSGWGYAYTSVYSDQEQTNNVKGLVTGVKTKVLNTGAWLYTVNYYDKYGRVLQQFQRNPEGGYNRVSTAYNFTGDPVKRQTYHRKTSSSTAITINEEYGYDHMRRPTYVKYGYNTTSLTTVAQFTYDELGRMSKKELHNGYQDIDYAYNIRGWLTQINNPTVTVSNSKLFAMQLYYETDMTGTLGGGAQYNGNISGAMWRLSGNSKKGYGFTYDGLNRLTIADYGTYSGSWANTSAYDLNPVGYDKNGNITNLTRKNSGGSNRESLGYIYIGNQLSSISGTYNGIYKSGNFSYDGNGNATSDGLRELTVTYFDELNLPKQYYQNSTNKVDYTYDAGGNKWSKTATVSGTASTTLYDGTFIYENGTLKKVLTSEGYYDPSAGRYYYYLKDHLGSTRLTFHYSGTTAVVDQEVEYYPFGSLFSENNLDKNKYLYNGKELNDEFFENYDYGARFYDAKLGQWHCSDPLAENYFNMSPYAYSADNPVLFKDINGMEFVGAYGFVDHTGSATSYIYDMEGIANKLMETTGTSSVTINNNTFMAQTSNSSVENNETEDKQPNPKGVAFMQVEGRIGGSVEGLGVTGSAAFGVMLDKKGKIAIYYVPSIGICSGGGLFCGVSGGLFFNARSIYDVKALGVNAGFIYSIGGKSYALEGNAATNLNNIRLGATMGTPLSTGVGIMGYVDASYLYIIKSYNISQMSFEDLSKEMNSIIPNSNYTPNDAAKIFQYLYNMMP